MTRSEIVENPLWGSRSASLLGKLLTKHTGKEIVKVGHGRYELSPAIQEKVNAAMAEALDEAGIY